MAVAGYEVRCCSFVRCARSRGDDRVFADRFAEGPRAIVPTPVGFVARVRGAAADPPFSVRMCWKKSGHRRRHPAKSVTSAARCKGYRYPIEVIGHAVWLSHRRGPTVRAAGRRHRQAGQLPGCARGSFVLGDPPPLEGPQQLGGESQQPTRVRERAMKRNTSPGQAQRFLFAFSHIREPSWPTVSRSGMK